MFDFFYPHIPDRTTLQERKLHAWALLMGERPRGAATIDRTGRPHRRMLPDYDPSIAVPDPEYSPWLRRLAAFLRRLAGPVEALEIVPAAMLAQSATPIAGEGAPDEVAGTEPASDAPVQAAVPYQLPVAA